MEPEASVAEPPGPGDHGEAPPTERHARRPLSQQLEAIDGERRQASTVHNIDGHLGAAGLEVESVGHARPAATAAASA